MQETLVKTTVNIDWISVYGSCLIIWQDSQNKATFRT